VYVPLVAATVFSCSDGSSFRTPTAPATDPDWPFVSYTGSFTVLGAEPAGDCVADAFARDRERSGALTVALPKAMAPGERGVFEIWASLSCNLEVRRSGGGELEVDIDPWCGWENSEWLYSEACGSVPAESLLFSKFVLPDPGAGTALRGTGQIVLDRGITVSGPLPTVTLTVAYDLRR